MSTPELLRDRLHEVGLTDVTHVEELHGGAVHAAGLAHRTSAPTLFAKTSRQRRQDDMFAAEADGLRSLRELGGIRTPRCASSRLTCWSSRR